MRKSNKRTIAIITAVIAVIVLAVILLLFVFNDKGGDAPDTSPTPGVSDTETPTTPDNSTPTQSGDTTTPDITTPDPGTSTTPTETPGESNPPDTSEPTLKHPIDDPNVTPHPDSPYAIRKAGINERIGYFETDFNFDVNKTIEEAYAKYGDLIDKDIIHPTFVKVLIMLCGRICYNTLLLNDAGWDSVNTLLETNGFEPLAPSRSNPKPSIEIGMIYLSAIAKEKGYGLDDLDELWCEYRNGLHTTTGINREHALNVFYEIYYPWLSKDAP